MCPILAKTGRNAHKPQKTTIGHAWGIQGAQQTPPDLTTLRPVNASSYFEENVTWRKIMRARKQLVGWVPQS
jgi:hypothetical protein